MVLRAADRATWTMCAALSPKGPCLTKLRSAKHQSNAWIASSRARVLAISKKLNATDGERPVISKCVLAIYKLKCEITHERTRRRVGGASVRMWR